MDKDKKMNDIRDLVEKKQYSFALKMLESMDVQTELTEKDLSLFAEVYIHNKQYSKAKALLEVMFKSNASKKVISQLIYVSLIMGKVEDAEKYYDEYVRIAPTDSNVLMFRYRIDKAKDVIPEILINTLEKLEEQSYNDEFAYDLADLYDRVGNHEKCIKKCNEIIVLTHNKSFENMAKSLKDRTMSAINIKKEDVDMLRMDTTTGAWNDFKETSEKIKLESKKESIAISELMKSSEESKTDFVNLAENISKGSDIDNIEAKARLNIELSAKKALEDKFKGIENKKKEVERKLKLEQSARAELEKKIKNYEGIKQSLEDKIKIQNKNKDYLEDLLKKSELERKEAEQKLSVIFDAKVNLENKFNKLDELSKSQSEKLIREVANSRKIEERLSEKELKVTQLIERLQLEEKTKSQLINNLETKEKYSENLEARLQNSEKLKSDLEVKFAQCVNKISQLEQKSSIDQNQIENLNMQLKNIMVEKNQLELNVRQYEQNRKMLQQNIADHVKNKQMLENRCSQIMEHKRHIEQRQRDTEALKKELELKVKEYEQKEIVLRDSLQVVKDEYSDYKNKKENEITLEQEKYNVDMKRSKDDFEDKIRKLREEKDNEIAALKKKNSDELEEVTRKLASEKDAQLQNIFTEKERELEKIKRDAENVENELKIEKEQLKRRLEKDTASIRKELETKLEEVTSDLQGKLDKLQDEYNKQSEHLQKSTNENRMLDVTLKEKISIINSLDARIKEVMDERKMLVEKNRELDNRLGIEISNNKKLDDMVTKHIEGKAHMENVIAKDKDTIKSLDGKNKQANDIIKKLEERVEYETDAKLKLEQRLHQSEIKCSNLEKELRAIKNQLKEQRNKEISLVEKSGEELLSSTSTHGMQSSASIELDDIGAPGSENYGNSVEIYNSLSSSVSQFLDEIVDDMDEDNDNEDINIDDMFNDSSVEDMLEDEELEDTEDLEDEIDENPINDDKDALPMIDLKALEAELNLAPITPKLEEVSDINTPAPRLRNQNNVNDNLGSFFDSPDVPDYKKQSYSSDDMSVVSQLFGTSDKVITQQNIDNDEKNQFYHEIMQSQMYEPFENGGFGDEYKSEPINVNLFAYFYFSPFIMDMIQKSVYGMMNNRKNNHIVISAPDYYNKTDLSKMIAKQLAEKNVIATNKIARISGEAFNKVDLDVKAPKLLDGTVIIQNAESINSGAFDKLIRLINNYEGRVVVILETSVPPAMLFANKPNVSSYFRGVVNLPKYSVNFLIDYVRTYLSVCSMGISTEAENELANIFNTKIKNNVMFSLEELQQYIESFMDAASKRKKGKGKHPTDIIIRQDINTNW